MAMDTRPFLAAGLRMQAVECEVGVYERALACKKVPSNRHRDVLAPAHTASFQAHTAIRCLRQSTRSTKDAFPFQDAGS
jgi:hypothetical protein